MPLESREPKVHLRKKENGVILRKLTQWWAGSRGRVRTCAWEKVYSQVRRTLRQASTKRKTVMLQTRNNAEAARSVVDIGTTIPVEVSWEKPETSRFGEEAAKVEISGTVGQSRKKGGGIPGRARDGGELAGQGEGDRAVRMDGTRATVRESARGAGRKGSQRGDLPVEERPGRDDTVVV